MRKTFLALLMMLCTLGMAFGQPEEAQQNQTTQNETKNNSGKDDCSAKKSKASQQPTEGDPEAPQNTVEYGAGG
ncbi:MAG TPA: hypothetical protein VEV41_28390 [Terriglobales bacterium]|nr:hypothetical protein [Terriglobales bacterium]